MSITITWLGHSAFLLDIDGHPVLIDPFLNDNPLAPVRADDVQAEMILLSHGHGDHVGDTIAIARRNGAPVVSNVEIGNWLASKGVEELVQINTGGTYRGDFLDVKLTMAFHSSGLPDGSYGGQPGGLLITANGHKLYFAGDTSLFMDMQLIGEEGLEVALLPIGDHYTMGIEDSLKAIKFLRPRLVIPMHYNTFPPIVQDVSEWANRVNSETPSTPVVLDPGGSYKLD
jgi:L-ascorbate metabolism protein UlaG (beta-lactamase superfamily)